ncbi:MAG: hypothetical protein FJW36_20055 [Acidobacteria bacterium]|nr:hypothetical protein [Acidobacteriota bacterium]
MSSTLPDSELVTIANYLFPHEARIAQAHLEAYDIPVFLENVNLITNDWLLATAIGGVPLKVPKSYEETARALLEAVDLEEDVEEEEN